jgi:hypothetical protein
VTGCRQVEPLLSELEDGTLDEARTRAVRGHLLECAACRAHGEAVHKIAAAAASLDAIDPPSSVWDSIAARLDEEEIAYSRRSRLWWWWQAFRRPLLIGSGALAAAALALVLFIRDRRVEVAPARRPVPATAQSLLDEALAEIDRAESGYVTAIDDLRAIVGEEKPRWPAAMQEAFDKNLADIDAAVERVREAARRAPGNLQAQEALYASYRREIDYLQEAVVRGGVL